MGLLPSSSAREGGKNNVLWLLRVFSSILSLRDWLVGERISLADLGLVCGLLLVFLRCLGAPEFELSLFLASQGGLVLSCIGNGACSRM